MISGKMTTIARPYAIAAFEYATAENNLLAWETMLDAAALVTQNPLAQQLLASPHVTSDQLVNLYCDVLATLLNKEKKNFICLLADYSRLAVLPGIAELFKLYRAAAEKKLTVQITSAIALDDDYQKKLVAALTKRLQRQISLECSIDENLLGGAMITAGDTVIDGSVRGKLTRLIDSIS